MHTPTSNSPGRSLPVDDCDDSPMESQEAYIVQYGSDYEGREQENGKALSPSRLKILSSTASSKTAGKEIRNEEESAMCTELQKPYQMTVLTEAPASYISDTGSPYTARRLMMDGEHNSEIMVSSSTGILGRPMKRSEGINCFFGKTYTENSQKSICYPVNRRKVARVNDEVYSEQYRNAICHAISKKREGNDCIIDVLFICEDVSLLPLLVPKKGMHSYDSNTRYRGKLT